MKNTKEEMVGYERIKKNFPTNDNYLSLGWPDLKLTSVISFV
jgi:hypothetical protein